jgi:hypothetical protein
MPRARIGFCRSGRRSTTSHLVTATLRESRQRGDPRNPSQPTPVRIDRTSQYRSLVQSRKQSVLGIHSIDQRSPDDQLVHSSLGAQLDRASRQQISRRIRQDFRPNHSATAIVPTRCIQHGRPPRTSPARAHACSTCHGLDLNACPNFELESSSAGKIRSTRRGRPLLDDGTDATES